MPEIGDYFVSGTGFGSSFIAGFQARAVRWFTYKSEDRHLKPKVNHAGIYVGNNQVVEAMPGGALLSPLEPYLGENTVWSNGKFLNGSITERELLGRLAKTKIGVPYGWGDIIALGLAQDKGPTTIDARKPYADQPWWVKRLVRPDRLTCGQLVDQVYLEAGIHLFNDGRWPGMVAPADIHKILL